MAEHEQHLTSLPDDELRETLEQMYPDEMGVEAQPKKRYIVGDSEEEDEKPIGQLPDGRALYHSENINNQVGRGRPRLVWPTKRDREVPEHENYSVFSPEQIGLTDPSISSFTSESLRRTEIIDTNGSVVPSEKPAPDQSYRQADR